MYIRGQRVIPSKERIQSKVVINPETDCWEWQGAKKGSNKLQQYGHLTVGSRTDGTRRSVSAHRYSYETYNGAIRDGLFVLHKCDNPCCVNPKHLFLGSHQDNVDDREAKGRNKPKQFGKHEKHPNAKLTWDNVNYIRANNLKRGDITRMSKIFNVGHKTISDICLFKTWMPNPPNPPEAESCGE